MITNDDTTLAVLKRLVATGRDSEQGYLTAADLIAEPELVQLFADKAVQRARFVAELKDRIKVLRGDPDHVEGTLAGEAHRTWMGMKATSELNDTHAVLAEVERGEDMAVAAYRDALAQRELDAQSRGIIQRQYEFVQAAHDRVRQLRDSAVYAQR